MIRPYRLGAGRYILGLALSSLLAGFTEAGILYLIVQAATLIAAGQPSTSIQLGPVSLQAVDLAEIILATLVLVVLLALLAAAVSISSARLVTGVVNRSRKRTFAAFARASWAEQSKEPEGHLQAMLSGHIQQIAQGVLRSTNALTALLNFLAYFVSAVVVDPLAAAGVIFGITIVGLILLPLSRITRRLSLANLRKTNEYAQQVTQFARLARDIKTFGVSEEVLRRADATADEAERIQTRSRILAKLTPQLYQCTALLVVITGIGLVSIVRGRDVGQLGAIVLLVVRALTYGQNVSTALQGMVEAEPYLRTVVRNERRFASAAVVRGSAAVGEVRSLAFRGVSFGYSSDKRVLHEIDFEVSHGETIGIIGPSGSGKSTIVQLLLRLYDPTAGSYEIDGMAARSFDAASWSSTFSLVPQENPLLTGTVAENIAFFRTSVDEARIEEAARTAHLHDDVMALPSGYQTLVGPGVRELSGGQRQRLGLARALVDRPSVLILDEPTSALDMRSEKLIQESLGDLRGKITLVIIAHRMPTLTICDRILVLDSGRLVTVGSHAELLEQSSYYRDALQLSGMLSLDEDDQVDD